MPKQEKQGWFAARFAEIRNFFFSSASKKQENVLSGGASVSPSNVTASEALSENSGFYEQTRPEVSFVLPSVTRDNPIYQDLDAVQGTDSNEYEIPQKNQSYYQRPVAASHYQQAPRNKQKSFHAPFGESDTDIYDTTANTFYSALPISAENAQENPYDDNRGFYAVSTELDGNNSSYPLYNNSRIEKDSLNGLSERSDQRFFYTQNSGATSSDHPVFAIPHEENLNEEEIYDYNHLAGFEGQQQKGSSKGLSNKELIENDLYGYANKGSSTGVENHPGHDLTHPGRTSFEATNVAAKRPVKGPHQEYGAFLKQEEATSKKIYGNQTAL